MEIKTESCRQCGNCCKNGGPALHSQDLELVRSGSLPINRLITLRKGELAHHPLTDTIQPIKNELVKIVGKKGRWDCSYYDEDAGCTIYQLRPEACKTLQCWDTYEISLLVEKDTLSRQDILGRDHHMLPFIAEHEEICPCTDLASIRDNYSGLTDSQKSSLTLQVQKEMIFRAHLVEEYNLTLQEELFYFGRPFFQLLQPFGVRVTEVKSKISLIW